MSAKNVLPAGKSDFSLIDESFLKSRIYTIRGVKVMLDSDLAEIYGYDKKVFNQQVKNNIEKFDDDFRFQLDRHEISDLISSYPASDLKSKLGMRTNSWTQLEDASCHTRKSRRKKPWKSFTT